VRLSGSRTWRGLRTGCRKLGAYALLQVPTSTDDLLLTTEGTLYSQQIALRPRHVLERRWAAVRPMASISEPLAAHAGLFTQIPRDLAGSPCGDRGCPRAGKKAEATLVLAEPSTRTGTKVDADGAIAYSHTPTRTHGAGRNAVDRVAFQMAQRPGRAGRAAFRCTCAVLCMSRNRPMSRSSRIAVDSSFPSTKRE
jgi:hypothetical protein